MNLRAPHLAFEPFDALAALCKAGGDSLRLNILRALTNDSFGVLELAQIFATGQSGISHHLKVLAQAGLVATRREGNAIFYRRTLAAEDQLGGRLQAALLDEIDQLSLPPEVQQRIGAVHQQRAAASQEFFARSAASFKAQQDLIAALPQYRDSLLALLDSLGFAAHASAVEIGPGDGSFLAELAKRFAQVTALDNSPAMLELAQQRCQQDGLTNVQLQLADALQDDYPAADCMVLNMVLHHFPAPAEALKQLAQRLKPGGSLLLSELCSHNQSWARETCGDLWLGFEQDDLARWATAAGLTPSESLYVGLRNGFQIQLRHFAKPSSTFGLRAPTHAKPQESDR
ncbi:ArsR/SmtB family transcription factor [Pseudomonas sp. 5P_3.1_Bac2]|uniref:ArsR/SmtB family transcription factor n=1 Tax=Pseudomonas sp. 5P_3.1_Bac2 TaxID=2971617 RepID=UPI0021CADD4A|nr:metalloregulator ArsR/SmtB family transcription factor [Pseudomonas sp. 5P_3.1_Bac2]MCU1718426.1 metalloregulator ArsR/SmtB family transcription factor [Pseudomonas sp. 5P_3.1_Bac2]